MHSNADDDVLTVLRFTGWIDDDQMMLLCSGLKETRVNKTTHLILAGSLRVILHDEPVVEHFCGTLQHCPNLIHLDISNNGFEDHVCESIASGLKQMVKPDSFLCWMQLLQQAGSEAHV